MKRVNNRKIATLNTLGSAGYVACLLQWLWASAILLPSIVTSPVFTFFNPESTTQPVPSAPVSEAATTAVEIPSFVTAIAFIVGIAIVVGAIYIMTVKFPRSVAKVGETATHTTATVVTPIITRNIHLTKKQQREIPEVIIIITKLLLIFLPLVLLLFAKDIPLVVSFFVVMFIGVVLFSWAFLLFALQYLLSRFFRVDYKKIR